MSVKTIKLAILFIQRNLHQLPIIILFTLLVSPNVLTANTPQQSNYSILDSLSKVAGNTIVAFLHQQSIDTCSISLSTHSTSWLLLQNIVSTKQLTAMEANSNTNYKADLQIEDCAVRYFLYNNSSDSLIREGQIITKGVLNKSGVLVEIPRFSTVIRDTIARDDIPFIEIPSYPFTKVQIPEKPKGFFTEIAEPLLFITAAAVTVLLLFTVRSQ